MKAKINTGSMTVEVEGEVEEIAQLISQQAPIVTSRTGYLDTEERPKAKVKASKKKGKAKAAKKTAKKKRARGKRKNWTPEENARFKELYNRKKTVKEMCDIFGRSEKSIYQHIIFLRNKKEIDAL